MSVVVFDSEVGDQLFAAQVAKGVLQLHQLNKEIMLGIQTRREHRAFKVKRQPLLDPVHSTALRQVQKKRQVQDDGGGQNGIPAEKIHFNLHLVSHPPEDIDIVPSLF